jgi:CheY-like chemotaxis protein
VTRTSTYLLVEDDEGQACVLSKWLKKIAEPDPIEVVTINNLEEAIQESQRLRPNGTFLDLLIPLRKGEPPAGIDDWRKVADQIKNLVEPVIVVTGLDVTAELKLYCIQQGAKHVYRKPYDTGLFSKLRADVKLFAAKISSAMSDAELRRKVGPHVERD